jgi:hypothetical protein
MVWMTDKTPHESLPMPDCSFNPTNPPIRQYFRLVLGEVTAWFANHSTPNPLGVLPPRGVRIVNGDKFTLYRDHHFRCWEVGGPAEILAALNEKEVRFELFRHCLGHLADRIVNFCGLRTLKELLNSEEQGLNVFEPEDYGGRSHDVPMWHNLMENLADLV